MTEPTERGQLGTCDAHAGHIKERPEQPHDRWNSCDDWRPVPAPAPSPTLPECVCNTPTPLVHAIWCPVYDALKAMDDTPAPATAPPSEWKPKKGDIVRATRSTDYFHKGERYTVAQGPRKGMSGIRVFGSTGIPVLTSVDVFVPDSPPAPATPEAPPRREGHSALRKVKGKPGLETYDPHPPAGTPPDLRAALVAAVPWLFEHGHHVNSQCYRGGDDGCWCGLDEAKKIVEKALASPSAPAPAPKAEREAFEAAMIADGYRKDHHLIQHQDGTYCKDFIEMAWKGWMFRAEAKAAGTQEEKS